MSKKYIYIDKQSKGLFAYFWAVMNILHYMEEDDSLYVDLLHCTPYFDINYEITNNVWEYYFKQPFDKFNDDSDQNIIKLTAVDSLGPLIFGLDGSGRYSLSTSSVNYEETRQKAKRVIDKYLRFQTNVLKKSDDFYYANMHNKNILGIHYRGGEAFHGGHGRNQHDKINIEYHFSIVDKYIDSYDKVLLITNDEFAKEAFENKYQEKLIRYDCELLCPKNTNSDITWLHNDRNYDKGEFATIECILFSKCSKLLATSSNLGCLSTLLSNGNFEFIDDNISYNP